MTGKICVLGSYVCQMSAILPHVPLLGETILAREFDMGQGGKGHNVAVAIRRLGTEVVLIEKIGQDIFGKMALESYQEEGIDAHHVSATDQVSSGIGLVYIQPSGENTAAYYPGANDFLSAEDIESAREGLQSAAILYLQLEIPDEPILTAVSLAKAANLKIILNPAPAREIPPGLLADVEVITPNQVEAFTLIGEPYKENLSIGEIKSLAEKLLELGPRQVYLTLGSRGAFFTNRAGQAHYQPRLPVAVVDTVGAGDAFYGALCVSLAKGLPPKESLFCACVNGALTTTKIGVINALPTTLEVEAYIKEYQGI